MDKYEVTVGRFRAFVDAIERWRPYAGDGAHANVPAASTHGKLEATFVEIGAADGGKPLLTISATF